MTTGDSRNHLPPQEVDEKLSLNPYTSFHLQNPTPKVASHIFIGKQPITLPLNNLDEQNNQARSINSGHYSSTAHHQPLHGNNKLAHHTFSEVVKGDTEVSKHLPPPTITLMPTAEFEGKHSVIFPISKKNKLVEKLKFVLVGKFSHGRPSWISIQDFFVKSKPTGLITTSIFDRKHIFIECSNKSDYYRIWLKLVWQIGGFNMRVFKWTSNFSTKIETPIAPAWVRIEGLPLYMFEERSLFSISNCIGKPIKIDSRNLQRTMLNSARVCVELDSSQPLIEDVWISFEDAQTKKPVEGFWVKVFYDEVPKYCHYCCHIGHGKENCKRRIENSTSQVRHSIGEVKVSAAHIAGVKPSHGAQIDVNMKGKLQLEGMLANQLIDTVVDERHLVTQALERQVSVAGASVAARAAGGVGEPHRKTEKVVAVEVYEDEVLVEDLTLEEGEIHENNAGGSDEGRSVAGDQAAVSVAELNAPVAGYSAGMHYTVGVTAAGGADAGELMSSAGNSAMEHVAVDPMSTAATAVLMSAVGMGAETQVLHQISAGQQEAAKATGSAGAEDNCSPDQQDVKLNSDHQVEQANVNKVNSEVHIEVPNKIDAKVATGVDTSAASPSWADLVETEAEEKIDCSDEVCGKHERVGTAGLFCVAEGYSLGTNCSRDKTQQEQFQSAADDFQQPYDYQQVEVNYMTTHQNFGCHEEQETGADQEKQATGENDAFSMFIERMQRLRDMSSSFYTFRSLSPVGRSSEKLSKLRKRVEHLKVEEGTALELDKERYKELDDLLNENLLHQITASKEQRKASSTKDST